ncbi:mevalonate kinase [Lapidilactobacillus gannanensis]|uniref:Mevalonate kinase n=1 Tax=Lapidilactobacillus gannanensis TaxID=2486002 RepID=A0ABW4BNH2_9LACO|nr:mevalonate kinase [Lapidilactobacillus gannanensis]
MKQLTTTGISHAKLILVGEHAVVYGTPAIAIPLPEITVTVQATATGSLTTGATQIMINSVLYHGDLALAPEELANLQALLAAFFDYWPAGSLRPEKISLTVTSQIPFERGMGSSAAIAIAITRALQKMLPEPYSPQIIAAIIATEEKVQHGNPSGLDALVVGASQGYYFLKQQQPQPITLTLPGYLLIVDSGQTGRTGVAIKQVAALRQQRPLFWQQQIDQIQQLVPQVRQLLTAEEQTTDLTTRQQKFGQLLDQNQLALRQLGVSTFDLDQQLAQLKAAGALGAKLTGGGLGGCSFGYFSNYARAQAAQQQFQQAGLTTWLTALNSTKESVHD